MSIDLRTVSLKPVRQTYGHIARRFGDKPASRYQEGTYDLQASANFHYRPTWDPERELFDAKRTAIRMKDWYALKDPRQYYYGAYTIARARYQEIAEAGFDFVESHGLVDDMDEGLRQRALQLLIPLRHVAWAANMNNAAIGAYGYGTAFTQAAVYHSMDHLGIAQYLTRIGLTLNGDPSVLDAAKSAWMEDARWQGLRRYVEDTLVLSDPFELHLAQNLVLDGLLYPLAYDIFTTDILSAKGGTAVAMLTRFMSDWFDETRKWVDATIRPVVAESEENHRQLRAWLDCWSPRAIDAVVPLVQLTFGDDADAVMRSLREQFEARLEKSGL